MPPRGCVAGRPTWRGLRYVAGHFLIAHPDVRQSSVSGLVAKALSEADQPIRGLPHCSRPQPKRVPVRSRWLRSTSSRGVSASAAITTDRPFTVKEIEAIGSSALPLPFGRCSPALFRCIAGDVSGGFAGSYKRKLAHHY